MNSHANCDQFQEGVYMTIRNPDRKSPLTPISRCMKKWNNPTPNKSLKVGELNTKSSVHSIDLSWWATHCGSWDRKGCPNLARACREFVVCIDTYTPQTRSRPRLPWWSQLVFVLRELIIICCLNHKVELHCTRNSELLIICFKLFLLRVRRKPCYIRSVYVGLCAWFRRSEQNRFPIIIRDVDNTVVLYLSL